MTAANILSTMDPVRLQGHFTVRKLSSSGEVLEELEFTNLITNLGLDTLMGAAGGGFDISVIGSNVKVGTSSATPVASTTTLPGYIASVSRTTNTCTANTTVAPYYHEVTNNFLYTVGAIVGTIANIGVHSIAGSGVSAYSLLKDPGGTPTTLTLTASEQLQCTYRIRAYQPVNASYTGGVTLAGIPYTFTAYYANFGGWGNGSSAYLQPITTGSVVNYTTFTPPATILAAPSYTGRVSAAGGNIAQQTYTNGNYYRDIIISSSISQSNVAGGIRALEMSGVLGALALIIDFNAAIPKDATKTMSLTFRVPLVRYP